MKFYRLKDDVHYPNRWYLGDILEVDNWQLKNSAPEINIILDMEVYQDGEEMDITLSEVYGVPIVSQKVKDKLSIYQELAFLPVNILKKKCATHYYVMVIKKSVDCVDENKSEFQKFEQNDPVRPDKAGEYRAFMKLRLDANKIVDVAIFRLAKFETAIIINEHIKKQLEAIGAIGLDLHSVV